jgi:hypothetical protein
VRPEEERLGRLVKQAIAPGEATPEFEERVLAAVGQESCGASGLPMGRARRAVRRHRGGWPLRRPRPPLRLAVAVAVIAAVALGILGAQRAGRVAAPWPATTGASRIPSAKALGTSMLDAFQAPGGQIAVVRQITVTSAGMQTEEWMMFPSAPRPGDQVRRHHVVTGAGTIDRETWSTYTQPAVTDRVTGDVVTADHTSRTWSDQPDGPIPSYVGFPMFEPDRIQSEVAAGRWTVDGVSQEVGRRVIDLSRSRHAPMATNYYLEVDAATYLPVRYVTDYLGIHQELETDYQFLPATPANLAPLKPSVPAGFSKTPPLPERR